MIKDVLSKFASANIFGRNKPKTNTIKFMFPVIISILAILSATVITSTDSSYIKLSPSQSVALNGEEFTIDVFAYAHVPVNALDLTIEFEPKSFAVLGIDTGQSVLTVWTQEPNVRDNIITLGGGTYRRGFIGEHLVATVRVKALYTGKTDISIKTAQLLAGDGKGTPVEISRNSSITKKSFVIYDQNTDPSVISAGIDVKIKSDINGDGQVNLQDVSAFMAAWYTKSEMYDFNSDNKMNIIDFSIILARSFLNQTE